MYKQKGGDYMNSIRTTPTSFKRLDELKAMGGWKTQKYLSVDYGMTSNELGAWLKSKGWKLTKGMISDEARDNGFAVNGAESTYGLNPLWNIKKLNPYLEQDGYFLITDKHERDVTRNILLFISSWNNRAGRAKLYGDLNLPRISSFQDMEQLTFVSTLHPFTLHEKFNTKAELRECIDMFDEMLSQRPGLLAPLGHRDVFDQYIGLCRNVVYTE